MPKFVRFFCDFHKCSVLLNLDHVIVIEEKHDREKNCNYLIFYNSVTSYHAKNKTMSEIEGQLHSNKLII